VRIAISIPHQLSKELDRRVRSTGRSPSELVNAALAEYMARHDLDEVTEPMSRVCADIGDHPDTFVADAGRRVLGKTEW
jgi:metal-responsive CopG/Arc/MetJ family transcriptional regulator